MFNFLREPQGRLSLVRSVLFEVPSLRLHVPRASSKKKFTARVLNAEEIKHDWDQRISMNPYTDEERYIHFPKVARLFLDFNAYPYENRKDLKVPHYSYLRSIH